MNFLTSLFTGLLSGLGIGGGSLFIIYLTYFVGFEHLEASLINLIYYIFASVPALIMHIKNRLVYFKATLYCVLSGIIFSALGAFLANNIETTYLQKGFSLFLIVVGLSMFFSSNEKT